MKNTNARPAGMLAEIVQTPFEAIRVITDNMLKVRPRAEVTYHPYRKNEIYYDQHLGLRMVDLKKLYPQAKPGNVVYIGTVIEACVESDATINFLGSAKVIYQGAEIFDSKTDRSPDGRNRCRLHLQKGRNPVTFMVRCEQDNSFEFAFMPSVHWYWVWAKCYLLSARATSPIDEYAGEDGIGISRLYEAEEEFDGVFVFPRVKQHSNQIDLADILDANRGQIAYALTYALADTTLAIQTECDHTLFVNGAEAVSPLKLRKGDEVLIKLIKGQTHSFRYCGEQIGIPFLHSNRSSGDKFLTLGAFDDATTPLEIQFKKPYTAANGEQVFWKLSDKDDYMRPYLSSRFFGQWHYTFMVGQFGLLNAAKMLDDPEYMAYFCDHMALMMEFFDLMRYEHTHFSSPSFLDISATLHDLDSIGSIGRNLCLYHRLTGCPNTLRVINTMLSAMETNIRRFPDGTFHRKTNMWADDTFMSCPFLVQAGIVKKEAWYHEEAIRQLLGFHKRLWMADKQIFSHIFYLEDQSANRIPWGRGNGWVYVSLSDALENIPADTAGHRELLAIFKEFTNGITKLQDEQGLWHQVLDRPDSYSETSCTAMFLIGLCRGIRLGILGKEYMENAHRAYDGLLSHKIKNDGTVYDVCRGSGCQRDVRYYMELNTVENDDHGTGVVLTALCEYIRLTQESL